MDKSQFILGKKVIAFILLIIVITTSMPLNVFGVSDATSPEPETNTVAENTVKNDESPIEETILQNSVVSDAPNEISNEVGDKPAATESKESVSKTVENLEQKIDAAKNSELQDKDEGKEGPGLLNDEEQQENKISEEQVKDAGEKNPDVKESSEEVKNEESKKEDETTDNKEIDVEENLQEDNEEKNELEDKLKDKDVDENLLPLTKQLSGNIVWKDDSNAYGTRPLNFKVRVFGTDETLAIKELDVIADSSGNWKYTFEELDIKDENGNEIKYKITANIIEGYTTIIDENNNIINTLTGTTNIAGSKVWLDNSNAYGTRPSEIIVNLYKNDGTVLVASKTYSSDENGNWNYVFENLEKYDENGVLIDYTVKENDILGYETTVTENVSTSKLVGKTFISGKIKWNDNEDSAKPEIVLVKLLKGNEKNSITSYSVGQDELGNWNYKFDNLEKYDETGSLITYTVATSEIEGYTTTLEVINENEINIVNSIKEEIDIEMTVEDLLANGPLFGYFIQNPEEFGEELPDYAYTIYEKYKELVLGRGSELAAVAMVAGTSSFTDEEIKIYTAYQDLVLNGGKFDNPLSTLAIVQDGDEYNGSKILAQWRPAVGGGYRYLATSYYNNQYGNNIVYNALKYVAPKNAGSNYKPVGGELLAYCMNLDREFESDLDYSGNPPTANGKYKDIYNKLYSELSYAVSIGAQKHGEKGTIYSTGGIWQEDYYVTQTVVYGILYDYTNNLKNIIPELTEEEAKQIQNDIKTLYSGHPIDSRLIANTSDIRFDPQGTRAKVVLKTVKDMYDDVKNYRKTLNNAQYEIDPSNASIELVLEEESYSNGVFEEVFSVETTGELLSLEVTGPAGSTVIYDEKTDTYEIDVPASSVAMDENSRTSGTIVVMARATFKNSQTVTYLSTDKDYQNIAFFQEATGNVVAKTARIGMRKTGLIDISGQKTWIDNNNAYNTRPTEIWVDLYAGETVVGSKKVTAESDWKYEFTGYKEQDDTGKVINYTVKERNVPNDYESTPNGGFNIVNKLVGTTELEIEKVWKDNANTYNTRPASITVELLRNGNVYKEEVIKNTNAINTNVWKYTFKDLPLYDENGVKYTYTIKEKDVISLAPTIGTYTSEVFGNTITNTLVGKTSLEGSKTWKDNNNAYGTRPDSIIVNLLANGEKIDQKEVTEGNEGDWKFFFSNLVKFDENGKKIDYTIKENGIEVNEDYYVDSYNKEKEDYNSIEINLENCLAGKTEISGVKIWHDSDNAYETRPSSIIVKLLANGKEFKKQTVTPDEKGDWKYSFEDLEEYDENGVRIVYTVDEVPVDRYVTDIKGTTLINTLIHNKQEELEIDSTPKTGNKNLLTFFSLNALLSLAGLMILNKKEDEI